MSKRIQLNVWLDPKTKHQFKVWAARHGVGMGRVCDDFIKQLLVGNLVYRRDEVPPFVLGNEEVQPNEPS